ncbi:hypothetical protein CUM74_07020 [Enterococcus faecalis]|nr:hypothetical protein CUM74_07020 [Enterococcus faecalis]
MTLKLSFSFLRFSLSFGTILNNMTLKRLPPPIKNFDRFGTILNNMTLKQRKMFRGKKKSFGTILNNMTLKPRRIIFSP